MTDSMNFGPDWIRNLSSEGSTGITGGGTGGGTRYQLAEYRYGREEMLALFDKNAKPPASVTNFKCLYSEQCLFPLALLPTTEEEMLSQQQPPVIRGWQSRPGAGGGGLGGVPTLGRGGGRGGSMDRGGRPSRGRGYQYGGGGRGTYDGSWGGPGAAGGPAVQGDPTGEQWSPRKEYSGGRGGMENWRRSRPMSDEHLSGEPVGEGAGWRRMPAPTSSMFEKWGRSTSWRDSTGAGGDDDRPPNTPAERQRGGSSWNSGGEGGRPPLRRPGGSGSWDHEDHLPEWATENPADGGGSFDDKGAFHGSDDEQLDGRVSNRREPGLQKSTSQQHISTKTHPPPLSSSKSSMSLVNKPEDSARKKESQKSREEDQNLTKENNAKSERKKSVPSIPEKVDKEILVQERAKSEGPQRSTSAASATTTEKSHHVVANGPLPDISRTSEEPDFEKLQEDFVLKLVVDEEPPRQQHQRHPPGGFEPPSGAGVTSVTVPPNLAAPPAMHHQQPSPKQNDKWFYQDPQGQTQGPFTDVEMAEWYKAGYFSNQLKVRRHHDERYFLLGELIALCGSASNPFSMAALRFPPLKADSAGAGAAGGPASPSVVGGKDAAVAAAAAADLLQLQYLSQMAAYKQAQARAAMAAEPWGAAAALQHEMAAAQQRLMMQQQVPQDLQYMQQPPTANPLMHMINQMQQANKLPGQGLVDTKPPNMPGTLDPHLQLHVGNLLSMQNRISPAGLASGMPTGLAPTLTGGLPPETIPGLQAAAAAVSLGPNGLPLTGLATTAGAAAAVPRPPDQMPGPQGGPQQDQDPISSLLKQLQQQKQQSQQIDSLWQQNQYGIPPTTAPPAGQWSAPNDVPLSMWDIQQSAPPISQPPSAAPVAVSQQQNQTPPSQNVPQVPVTEPEKEQTVHTPKKEKDKESKKEDKELKEAKKKKEQDEKQAKKDAEERKRQELRKQEAEKKAAEEKKRKEEERMKKELEKVKREAEEKRQRELEEKRRLKEQRKAEEENRKKLEEQRKVEEQQHAEEERLKVERELETKREQQTRGVAKTAPWSQSNSTAGMSLAEIQKAEREKRAQDAVIQMQRLQEQEIMQQKEQEKIVSGIQLNWAKKPMEPRKVKSLAEIQAEEQERLAKQLAESRLQKEKEPPQVVTNTASNIWNGQNLNWSTASAQSTQWSATSVAVAGFWEESNSGRPAAAVKPSVVSKSNSTNNFQQQQQQAAKQKQQQQQAKAKAKKEETAKANHNNNNGPATDEFTTWCYKTLSNISTNVDIPTFVSFLRDIESAFDVREYCKEYLGESGATHQFASSFLERRRQCRPQRRDQHKDDMCVPAPAITPQGGHTTGIGEFQEVKGKNKKTKKSKMLKIDSRILGFNVTSAPDRINVGDRDYGDNS